MRFTASGGEVAADGDSKNDGRGFYLCRDNECIEKAIKNKAFNRILRSAVDTEKIRRVAESALHSS